MKIQIFGSKVTIDSSIVTESASEIRRQVSAYERGDRQRFELTVRLPDGLTGDVMAEMTDIPYGETRTYGDLAVALDTSPVAVGQACGRNPVPLVVPCHRVVGSDGSLKGYSAADGIVTKRELLDFEARHSGASTQTRLSCE